ncbi:MAG: DUF1194 domain-containing protein [Rhodospirillaceae bacterium]|nr:DUF1194 domain-containing protein [Rhodospirillaceae bacterium]
MAFIGLAEPARAQGTPVHLELVLAVDTSSSVNFEEFSLQMNGYAAAFRNPDLIEAIQGLGDQGVAVTLVQWASAEQQEMSVDWAHIRNSADAEAFAAAIQNTPRAFSFGSTAIGELIRRAVPQFDLNGYEGERKVIDISGDGRTNQGLPPEMVREAAIVQGVTINALAILNEEPGLDAYYDKYVIGGWSSFVMVARDFVDFQDAILGKLLREVRGAPISARPETNRLAWRMPPMDEPSNSTASTVGRM